MSHGLDASIGSSGTGAQLRAVVTVDENSRVQCQQPGCGHSVYAAIHVVEEGGRLLVLGSTCFAKRYGSANALGSAQFGGGGGRKLTEEERQMLVKNTVALLAHSEARANAEIEAVELARDQSYAEELQRKQSISDKLQKLREANEVHQAARSRRMDTQGLATLAPWHWQKELSSVAVFTAPGGSYWVRVQHQDGSQKLVPWPQFPGWEAALPDGIGVPDTAVGAIAVRNMVEAIQILQQNGYQGPIVGRWRDVRPRPSKP